MLSEGGFVFHQCQLCKLYQLPESILPERGSPSHSEPSDLVLQSDKGMELYAHSNSNALANSLHTQELCTISDNKSQTSV